MRQNEQFDTRPFLIIRRAYTDVLRAGRRKNLVHGLVELDVTTARRALRDRAARGAPPVSFTAFLMYCVARAADRPHRARLSPRQPTDSVP